MWEPLQKVGGETSSRAAHLLGRVRSKVIWRPFMRGVLSQKKVIPSTKEWLQVGWLTSLLWASTHPGNISLSFFGLWRHSPGGTHRQLRPPSGGSLLNALSPPSQSRQEACMREDPCVLQGHLHTQANHGCLLVLSPDFPADPSGGLRTAGKMGNLNRSQWLGQGSELVSPAQELLASFQMTIYCSTSVRPEQGQQRHWLLWSRGACS